MLKTVNKLLTNDIIKSSLGIFIITILVKAFGYIEKIMLAKYFGTSSQVDAYTVVLTIILSLFFFFRELIEPGFLNVFLGSKNKGDEDGAWAVFNKGLRFILLTTVIIGFVSFFYPGIFTRLFSPGFEGDELILTQKLIRIAVPASIFLALSALTSITLNGLKIFVLPSSGELVFKLGIVVCMVAFYKEYGIVGAAIGILAGSAGRLLVHLTVLYKKIRFRKVTVQAEYKKRIWLLTWPLLIGVSFSQISSLVDNVFASFLQEGAIASLSYAKKIVELPVVMFPYVISIVVFPYFSQLALEKRETKLKALLAGSLKWILIAFIPISAFFFIYAVPVIEIILERGAFDAKSTLLTSKPLGIYALGMVFFAIETILVIFYYANADTKTPVFVGIACVILNIILTYIFIQFMGYIGIALAFVIQKTLKNLILLYLIKKKVTYNLKAIWPFLIRLAASSLLFIVLLYYANLLFYNDYATTMISKIGFLGLTFIVGTFVYLFMLYILGILNPIRIRSETN